MLLVCYIILKLYAKNCRVNTMRLLSHLQHPILEFLKKNYAWSRSARQAVRRIAKSTKNCTVPEYLYNWKKILEEFQSKYRAEKSILCQIVRYFFFFFEKQFMRNDLIVYPPSRFEKRVIMNWIFFHGELSSKWTGNQEQCARFISRTTIMFNQWTGGSHCTVSRIFFQHSFSYSPAFCLPIDNARIFGRFNNDFFTLKFLLPDTRDQVVLPLTMRD